jgi:hypothetical protein
MKLRRFSVIVGAALLFQTLVLAEQVPTRLRVRVVSRDAKVVGTGVGGASVTIRNLETGAILAKGIQLGKTGDTDKIMVQPRERFATVYDTEGAAFFETTLMLERATPVQVTAEGPLGYPQALQSSSKTLLLVPGKDVLGEGLLLELNGFIVQILAPEDGRELSAGFSTTVRAKMTMT